jgi:hypothetical protein
MAAREDQLLPAGQPTDRWRGLAGRVTAVALFLWGMWSFPVALLGPERNLIPGDMGDARFNNYVLEHFHQYASGRVDRYWDAPMMYPWPNVIAHSDNLLGTAPLYHLVRTMGWNRESAFQIWILLLFALNYWCCFIALRAWTGETVLAATGAFIFAFGIHQIGHLYHVQVFPRFMVPLAFLAFWRWLGSGGAWSLGLAILAVVYQFYCGIYLGFMLAYALAFLAIGHLFVYRRSGAWAHVSKLKQLLVWAGLLIAGVVLLLPLMLPYLEVSRTLGMREFHEVEASIPRPISYFFTHPAALSWRDLSHHSQFAFPEWWHHFHFVGALPWVAIIAVVLALVRRWAPLPQHRAMAAVLIAFALSTLFWLNFGGFTLYRVVYLLPGFSAMRSLDRIINVQVMYFAILFVMGAGLLFKRPASAWALAIVLPFAAALENQVDVGWTKRFDKHEARQEVDKLARHILVQMPADAKAVAYMPLLSIIPWEQVHDRRIETNITAILAAQQVGVPIVNAYTGSYPGNYMGFFDHMDRPHLEAWVQHCGITTDGIAEVNDLDMPAVDTDTLYLHTATGHAVHARTGHAPGILGLDEGEGPTALLLIRTLDDRHALRTPGGAFIVAYTHEDGRLKAASQLLGDMGLFRLEEAEEGLHLLRADDGRYVALDADAQLLHARAPGPGQAMAFRLAGPGGRAIRWLP